MDFLQLLKLLQDFPSAGRCPSIHALCRVFPCWTCEAGPQIIYTGTTVFPKTTAVTPTVCPLKLGRLLLPSWTLMMTVVELDNFTTSPWSLASTTTVNLSATLIQPDKDKSPLIFLCKINNYNIMTLYRLSDFRTVR